MRGSLSSQSSVSAYPAQAPPPPALICSICFLSSLIAPVGALVDLATVCTCSADGFVALADAARVEVVMAPDTNALPASTVTITVRDWIVLRMVFIDGLPA